MFTYLVNLFALLFGSPIPSVRYKVENLKEQTMKFFYHYQEAQRYVEYCALIEPDFSYPIESLYPGSEVFILTEY